MNRGILLAMTPEPAETFSRMGTLGVEEEFFVVDDAGRPTAGTDELVYETTPPEILEDRLDHELFKCIIETQTPVIERPADARETLLDVRDALTRHATEHGYQIAAAGLHPGANWRTLQHATKPRYREQLERIQYPQHRNTTAGLHVHVGVDSPGKAMWIANEVRWYLPVLLALSANSPYWCGFDTGLASARAKIFEALPNTGMPGAFDSYESFANHESLLVETNSVSDRGELWWDVRPHSELGTVELRVPDEQADPERILAFVEFVHALVVDLGERYEDSPDPFEKYRSNSGLRRELLDENKWRALRYGHDASFIRRDREGEISLDEAVTRVCDRLGVDGLRTLSAGESGAARQRQLYETEGEDALFDSLVLPRSRPP